MDLEKTAWTIDVLARKAFIAAFAEAWHYRFSLSDAALYRATENANPAVPFVNNPIIRDRFLTDTRTPAMKKLYNVSMRIYRENKGQIPIFRNPAIPKVPGWQ